MPLYEYKCQSCGKTFEVIQKFADEPLKSHPECGGDVEKLFSAPAFHLKGTGWYATDYAKGNGANTGKSDESGSDSKSKTDGSAPPATETKSSDGKSESKASHPGSSENKNSE